MRALFLKLTGLTAARLAGSVAAFLSSLLIARHFGAEALAAFAVWMSVAGILSVLMPAGAQSLAPIIVSKAASAGQRRNAESILSFGRMSTLAFFLVLVAGGLVCAFTYADSFDDTALHIYLSMVLIAPLMAIVQLHGGALNGLRRHLSGQLPDTLLKPLVFLSLLATSAYVFGGESRSLILFALASSLLLAALIQTVSLSRAIGMIPVGGSKSADRQLGAGKTASWLTISLLWDYQIEILMIAIALVADPVEVAVLYVCFRIRVLLGFGIKSIYQVLQPAIYSADPVEDAALIRRQIDRINVLSIGYAVFSVLAIYAGGAMVLGVFKPEFAGHGDALLAICMVLMARAVFGPGMTVLAAHGHHANIALTLLAGTVLTVCSSLVAYYPFGIIGVATAYVVSSGVTAWILSVIAQRKTGVKTMSQRNSVSGALGVRTTSFAAEM